MDLQQSSLCTHLAPCPPADSYLFARSSKSMVKGAVAGRVNSNGKAWSPGVDQRVQIHKSHSQKKRVQIDKCHSQKNKKVQIHKCHSRIDTLCPSGSARAVCVKQHSFCARLSSVL